MNNIISKLKKKPDTFIKITGKLNYFIDVQIKTGTPPYQSSTITITAFVASDKKYVVATKQRWFRTKGTRSYFLYGVNSNIY